MFGDRSWKFRGSKGLEQAWVGARARTGSRCDGAADVECNEQPYVAVAARLKQG